MDEYEDWILDDSAEMAAMLREVLADSTRSEDEKLEALTMLANLADDEAVRVLRWYSHHADTGFELVAQLALIEAEQLRSAPSPAPWDAELVEFVIDIGDELYNSLGTTASLATWRATLAGILREAGFHTHADARALLKYKGQLVEIAPLDLIVEGEALVSIWTDEREARRLDAWTEEEVYEPFDYFYSWLRTANLRWGILLDVTPPRPSGVTWDVVGNSERNASPTKLEHILAIPPQAS